MSIPLVSSASFRSLVGDALAGRLDEMLERRDFTDLVLFSDAAGGRIALLPVGPGQRFERLAAVAGLEVDGLRPLCAFHPREDGADGTEASLVRESLDARERYLAECEHRMAEVGQGLSEREAQLEQREQQLLTKEREFFRRSGELNRQNGEGEPGGRPA